MGRYLKTGLDYFPFEVDFFEDDKLQFVYARFGNKGLLITIKLLCKIYKEGCFIQWDNDTCLLFAKRAGEDITHSLVNDVVSELVKRSFFDKRIFDEFSVLTSRGIQKRYIKICTDSKRKNINTPEHLRLTTEEITFTPEFIPQSKVKESKVNKSKEDEPKGNAPPPSSIQFLSLTDLKKQLLENKPAQERYYRQKGSLDNFETWIDSFNQHLGVTSDTMKTIKDYNSHFFNWLTKQPNTTPILKPKQEIKPKTVAQILAERNSKA